MKIHALLKISSQFLVYELYDVYENQITKLFRMNCTMYMSRPSVRKYAYPIGQRTLPNYIDTHVNMRGCKSSKRKTIPLGNEVQDCPNNYNMIEVIILINLSYYFIEFLQNSGNYEDAKLEYEFGNPTRISTNKAQLLQQTHFPV